MTQSYRTCEMVASCKGGALWQDHDAFLFYNYEITILAEYYEQMR